LTDGDNFIFEVLSEQERNMLVERMECVSYRKGGVIIKQGDEGDYFYVITEGDVDVYVSKARQDKLIAASLGPIASNDNFDVTLNKEEDIIDMLVDDDEEEEGAVSFVPKPAGRDRRYSSLVDAFASNEDDEEEMDDEEAKDETPKELPVAVLGPGDTFGELSLLYNAPRMATCVASTNCTLWRLHVDDFRGIMNGVRQSEMEATQNDGSIVSVIDTLKSIPTLQALDEHRFSQLADALVPVRFSRGEQITKKGEKFDMLYIIKSGEVLLHDVGTGDAQHSSAQVGPGDFFGIQELLSGAPSDATRTAVSDTVVTYALSKEQFEAKLGSLEDVLKRCALRNQLKTIPIFAKSEFEPHEFETLSEEAEYKDFDALHTLATAGKPSEPTLYVVVSGSVQVCDEVKNTINTFKCGEYFGGETLKPVEDEKAQDSTAKEHISDQTIEVIEPTTCAVLTRAAVEKAIGNISRLGKPLPPVLSKLDRTIKLDDLNHKRILGIGSFGKVWLVQHKKTNAIYALKTMEKKQILKLKLHKNVLREKNIMASVDHPFIIELKAAFQSNHHLYMLANFIQGGELFTVIHKDDEEAGLDNNAAVFYAACVLESLAHLHKRNICYRDLKPENILVDKDGYCVLIDMGFAKVVLDKTHSICGTPEYLAPELILHKGHNTSVDDWALGVLIYEMFVGQSPFFRPGSTQQAMFKRIVNGTYMFPSLALHGIDVPYNAQSLISKLLVKNPSDRLGCFAGGASDIKCHPFFEGIFDNDDLVKKKIAAPWVPEVKDALDASNFDDYSSEERKNRFWYSDDLSEQQQAKFKDF